VFEVWACNAVRVVAFEAAPPAGAFGGIVMAIRNKIHSDLSKGLERY
jgi:hypothetical protein